MCARVCVSNQNRRRQRTCMMNLVDSVLPAPDSPDTRIDWLGDAAWPAAPSGPVMARYAASATA